MTNFIVLRPKTYSYLTDDHNEKKKEKVQKSVLETKKLNLKSMNIV